MGGSKVLKVMFLWIKIMCLYCISGELWVTFGGQCSCEIVYEGVVGISTDK